MIKNNPFISPAYTKIWCQHFIKNRVLYTFNFIKGVSFLKMPVLPVYVNIGKTLTKGISYEINTDGTSDDFKKKILLIYDVPKYFNIQNSSLPSKIKLIKIKQYPGFLTNLESYPDFNSYLSSTFSKKSRYKFKSYKRKLEDAFTISYVNYNHTTTEDDYNYVFKTFYELLSKRFEEKSESNNNLNEQEWNFYKTLVFPLLKAKKASLFAVLNNNKPIAISLNYFSENVLFLAMTGFDIEYKNYNVGTVHLMELFKWCFENNIKIFDFSKGYYDYKERWSDLKYNFENHVFYDSASVSSTLIASSIASYFKLKQYLRDKNAGGMLSKLNFYLKN